MQEVNVPVVGENIETGVFGYNVYDQLFWTVVHVAILVVLCYCANSHVVTVDRMRNNVVAVTTNWLVDKKEEEMCLTDLHGVQLTDSSLLFANQAQKDRELQINLFFKNPAYEAGELIKVNAIT